MSNNIDQNQIAVLIAKDLSQAEIVIPYTMSQDPLLLQHCHAALTHVGIELTEQVDAKIKKVIAQETQVGKPLRGVIAKTTPPIHGIHGYVDWVIDRKEKSPQAAPQNEKAHNYYEDSAYVTVKEGQVVAQIIEPTLGIDGRDMKGKTLAAKMARVAELQFDESLVKNARGQLICQADGVLVRKHHQACVRNVIEVPHFVDFNTGNIDFDGNVIVHQGVRDCFIVKAKGDIEVKGLVEAATIECGGDLSVLGGMAGREEGIAKVGNNFTGRYLDNINAQVGGDLEIDREIINCKITVQGNVNMANGAIIGGEYVVVGEVDVATLGSTANVPTLFTLGTVPELDDFSVTLEKFVAELTEKRDKLTEEIEMINRNTRRLTAHDRERQTEIMFETSMANNALVKAEDALQKVFCRAEKRRTIHLTANRMIHAGVLLKIKDQIFKLTNDLKGPVSIEMKNRKEVIYKQYDAVTPLVKAATVHLTLPTS